MNTYKKPSHYLYVQIILEDQYCWLREMQKKVESWPKKIFLETLCTLEYYNTLDKISIIQTASSP